MIFHGYFRSSSAYRCRIAFNLKNIGYDFVSVHLRKGGGQQKLPVYTALNPQALVPTLEVDEEVMTQSLAIIEWLDETYPEPPLLPTEPFVRAKARAFAQVIACDIHPLQNLRVLAYLRETFAADQAALDIWCQRWIGDGLAACEALLAGEPKQAFAFGDRPGLAEICLIPQMFSADRFGLSLEAYPRLRRLRETCEALPAFAEAHPMKQPDAEAA
ncbi:maleylacetoacetate isomerase [Ensifer sp. Root31]|uniref:maleylacetoacetate isomerase n=1 Tax=Ensifer sp. Root31 TaxID=1736512 RepID=UPI00070E9F01|nr:maleylacetoacetate isomerase [Ensifer sp. Root31]KQU86380.1 maleylacetoacetate isomerase [Ensifer sp. Root31]